MRTRAPTKTCTIDGCGHALRARGLCSTHYNQQHQPERHAAKPTACTICGAAIMRPPKANRRPACSVACRTVIEFGYTTDGSGLYDWTKDAYRRAWQAGSPLIKAFDRDDIFERDDWICYLCGESVDRSASPFHPDSPTVDHVVPLSKGGHHVAGNARTAHLRCNSAKQDRPATITTA